MEGSAVMTVLAETAHDQHEFAIRGLFRRLLEITELQRCYLVALAALLEETDEECFYDAREW